MKKITLLIAFLVSIKSYSQCWQNISTGDNHILAVKNDGTLWAWGSNNYGKCGPSFQNYTNTPTQVGSENNWLKASPAIYHSMAIKTNGDLYGWGQNISGNIGIGTSGINNAIIPFSVHIGNSAWSSISCGNNFTIAINSDGTLWAWGDNSQGQLGDGTTTFKTIPTQIGVSNSWNKIATGYFKGYGIKLDGTLWTWGINFLTQIGNSNNWEVITRDYAIKNDGTLWDISSTPIQVGTDSDWVSVTRNFQGNHQLALKSNGTLWAWGENGYGELGDGTNLPIANPIQIGTNSNWTFISAGEKYSLALNSYGELWTWGANYFGQLGDASFVDKNLPTLINCPTTLGILDTDLTIPIKIFPNPTKNIINIDTSSLKSVNKITVLNITGQKILEVDKNVTYINVDKLQAGIYFILIQSENKKYITKFIKEN